MSLFENDEYRWRETYFVLLDSKHCPASEKIEKAIQQLNPRYQVTDIRHDDGGGLESLTVFFPDDYAAMDITYTSGEEVTEQIPELMDDLKAAGLSAAEKVRLQKIPHCDARFDIYHFEQVVGGGDEEEEMLDPGSLLVVLEKLAKLCKGIGVDPQSGTLID